MESYNLQIEDINKLKYFIEHKVKYEDVIKKHELIPLCWLRSSFSYEKIMKDIEKQKSESSNYSPYDFKVPDELEKWVEENICFGRDKHKSLLLVGSSRIGKTQWARSLGNHVHWQSACYLPEWKDDAKYVILDNLQWEEEINIQGKMFIKVLKNLIGCKGEFEICDYREKKVYYSTWSRPCIILCNSDDDPTTILSDEFSDLRNFINENVIRVDLGSKCLF